MSQCGRCPVSLICNATLISYKYVCPYCDRLIVWIPEEIILKVVCPLRCNAGFYKPWLIKCLGTIRYSRSKSEELYTCTMEHDPGPRGKRDGLLAIKLCNDCYFALSRCSQHVRGELLKEKLNALQ